MTLEFIDKNEYEKYFVGKDNVSMQMRSDMGSMFEAVGWTCHYVGLKENEQLVGTCMLCGKMMKYVGMYYICQYGPHLNYDDDEIIYNFFSQLPVLLKLLNACKFEFNPNLICNRYTLSGEVTEINSYPNLYILKQLGYQKSDLDINTNGRWNMRYHYVKSLDGLTKDKLLSSYNSQGKRSVKKSIANGIVVSEIESNQLPQFHKLMELSATKHGFSARNLNYYEHIKTHLGSNLKLLVAKVNVERYIAQKQLETKETLEKIKNFDGTKKANQIDDLNRKLETIKSDVQIIENSDDIIEGEIFMSAGMFIINGDELIYVLGGNDGKYQKFCSSYRLQDYAMNLGIELGVKEYNMYGIDGTFDNTDSVFRFKSSFDGYVNEFVGTYSLELKPHRIKFANAIKQIIRR